MPDQGRQSDVKAAFLSPHSAWQLVREYLHRISWCPQIKNFYLEWWIRFSDSEAKRQPRMLGSRFFICRRPIVPEQCPKKHSTKNVKRITLKFPQCGPSGCADFGSTHFYWVLFPRREGNMSGLIYPCHFFNLKYHIFLLKNVDNLASLIWPAVKGTRLVDQGTAGTQHYLWTPIHCSPWRR